jgi:hypothetical protein
LEKGLTALKFTVFNHCGGIETVPFDLQNDVSNSLKAVTIKVCKGSGAKIRDGFLQILYVAGWSREVEISINSEITITSMKNNVGLCFQTGNMARMYADLLKLQKLYLDNSITSAIIVVPSQMTAKAIGDNVAHSNRLERELEIFNKVINLPLILYSME